MAKATAELYDEDFYAWTQQQAEALRHRDVMAEAGIDLSEGAEQTGKRRRKGKT